MDPATGYLTLEATQWLQNPDFVSVEIDTPLSVESGGTGQDTGLTASLQMAGPMYPAMPTGQQTGAAQTAVALWAGVGVPDNAGGQNGDFYLRSNGSAGTLIYHKAGGLWTALA